MGYLNKNSTVLVYLNWYDYSGEDKTLSKNLIYFSYQLQEYKPTGNRQCNESFLYTCTFKWYELLLTKLLQEATIY